MNDASQVSRAAGVLVLDPSDNVAVALSALVAGKEALVGLSTIRVRADIPAGHKIALANIEAGSDVLKYGEVIGIATQEIRCGDHVHIHNVMGKRVEQMDL